MFLLFICPCFLVYYWVAAISDSIRYLSFMFVSGHIRLKRTDPSTLDDPSTDCGMDVTPGDGVACTKDDTGKDIVPPASQVCGTSGVLYDTSIPLGGHLL